MFSLLKSFFVCCVSFLSFLFFVPSLSAQIPFTSFEFVNRLTIGLGTGIEPDFLELSNTLGALDGALERGGARDTLRRYQAIEDRAPEVNPTSNVGGCPDTQQLFSEPVEAGGGTTFLPQIVSFNATQCSVLESFGEGSSIITAELDFNLEYQIFPWFFLRTGFAGAFPSAKTYGLILDYVAEAKDIRATGIPGGVLNALLSSRGRSVVRVSAYQFRIPFIMGFNLIQLSRASFYVGFGIAYVYTNYTRQTTAEGVSTFIAQDVDQGIEVIESYEKTVNTLAAGDVGFIVITGGKVNLWRGLGAYAEIRWLTVGAIAKLQGTDRQVGVNYADSASASVTIDQVAPGVIAKALQTSESPDGAIRQSGLSAGFSARFFFGIHYAFDFNPKRKSS